MSITVFGAIIYIVGIIFCVEESWAIVWPLKLIKFFIQQVCVVLFSDWGDI